MTRDAALEPQITPPEELTPEDVRKKFPGAVEQLERWEDHGYLTLSDDGTFLIFCSDTPTDEIVWGLNGRDIWTDWDGDVIPGQAIQ